jgi:hypothetical protein
MVGNRVSERTLVSGQVFPHVVHRDRLGATHPDRHETCETDH